MPRSGGTRRDSRIANQRRLCLVQRLLRGPAPAETLIADLCAVLGNDIYPADARAALRHDMTALCDTFGCEFVFRTGEGYVLTKLGSLALLDPTSDEIESLALLFAAIDEGAVPRTPAMLQLKARICALMPEAVHPRVAQAPQLLRLDLPTPSSRAVDSLIARLRPLLGKAEMTFHYCSPYTAPDRVEQHHVAPYELFQRDGSTYLEAYCIAADMPKLNNRYISYRLDRIVPKSVRRLPRRLSPVRYARRSYQLRYQLSAAVARRQDVTLWFEGSTCRYTEDGGALVEARIHDLWYARNVLMRYREHCRVLEPHQLMEMIRDSIERMEALYARVEDTDATTTLE
jgi:predicted DNA-binding transcriptional regulator YafY